MNHIKHDREYFYKFLSYEGALKTLLERRIRLTSSKLFNDPHDAKFKIKPPFSSSEEFLDFSVREMIRIAKTGNFPNHWSTTNRDFSRVKPNSNFNEADLIKYVKEGQARKYEKKFQDYIDNLNATIDEAFGKSFYYCMTEDISNSAMWAHYADKHQGAVIKFKCIPKIDNLFLLATQVKYMNQEPTYGSKDDWLKIINENISPDLRMLVDNKYATKGMDWEREKEWRIIAPMPEYEGQDYAYNGISNQEVESVYLGCNMSSIEKERLTAAVVNCYPESEIYQAIKDQGFSINFKKMYGMGIE